MLQAPEVQNLDVTGVAIVPHHIEYTPRAMVPDVASCKIMSTFLAAE